MTGLSSIWLLARVQLSVSRTCRLIQTAKIARNATSEARVTRTRARLRWRGACWSTEGVSGVIAWASYRVTATAGGAVSAVVDRRRVSGAAVSPWATTLIRTVTVMTRKID